MATTPSSFNVFTNRLFGSFKDTEIVESAHKALETEYEELLSFSQSDELLRYQELKAWVDTKEHLKVKQEMESLTFKGSPEFTDEKEFAKLSSNSAIKNYLKLSQSDIPNFFNTFSQSGLPEEYAELEKFTASPEYKKNRSAYKKDNAPEYQKELRFKELKANVDLKKYFKLKKDKALKDYFDIEESEVLKKYQALKEKVESAEFKDRKNYLLSKNKFEQTDVFKQFKEYKALESSEKIKWYNKTKTSNKFDVLKIWTLAFHDDFDGKSLDTQKWLPKFFWGDAILNKAYSFSANEQFYSESSNFEIKDSVLKIVTRKERAEGLAWDKKFGFVPKTFDFTSGVINTGHIYRQNRGKVEAKVKLSCVPGVFHSFYLVGDKMLPELDVFLKSDSKSSSISAAYFWTNGDAGKVRKSVNSINGLKFESKFYILGVEWDDKSIVWTINGTPYKVQANLNPNESLYLVLASGVQKGVDESKLPAFMEIDWVKCWNRV